MKVVVIGATSGIGRALAKKMSSSGCVLGITGRRLELLDSLETELASECYKSQFDVTDVEQSTAAFEALVAEMGSIDVVVINSGYGNTDPQFPLAEEVQTALVNVVGFTTIANLAYRHFQQQGAGHIVGISSVAAVRGGPFATYNASKAYVSSYLEGLGCRKESRSGAITITDIRPGFVNTDMAKGDGLFWVASPEKAADQIYTAIKAKKRIVYITRRWTMVAYLIMSLPFSLYRRIIGQGAGV